MSKRINIKRAGRLVSGVVYTVPHPRDPEIIRADKTQMSTAARDRMNLKQSWQKLELVLAANFSYDNLLLTMTYADEYLPPTRDRAKKVLKKAIRLLREQRQKESGEATAYVYVTEGNHGTRRLHHHMVLDITAKEVDSIRKLWPYGNVDFEPLGKLGYTKAAKYLTKEPRDGGRVQVGERTWTPSLGLKRPVPETGWVPDNYTLTAPPGAHVLFSEPVHNEFGEFAYIKYLLPEKVKDWPEQFRRPVSAKIS